MTLSPGDLVESTHDYETAPRGTVARVTSVDDITGSFLSCAICATRRLATVVLQLTIPDPQGIGWCPEHWRPISGERIDMVRSLLRAPELEDA